MPAREEIVELASPLLEGTYLVTSGGSTEAVNTHVRTLNPITARMAAFRGQSYAVDLVKLNRLGLRTEGVQPLDPGNYEIFGEPLLAPCNGTVVHAEDGHPDMPVPTADTEHMPGNHILLDCGGPVVLMAHMRRGSVAVVENAAVITGDHVGDVGNSGNTEEPHLHIHAQRPGTADAPLSGDPLPIRINGHYLVRNDRLKAK